jgi:aspartate aminotransferase
MKLASRMRDIAPPATLAQAEKAKELARAGVDVVSLTAGEPDFDAPPHVVEAMVEALRRGQTRYTAVAGIPELRGALAARYRARGLACDEAQVIVSTGAKQCIFGAVLSLCDPGDEVAMIAPYWLSYADIARLAGARPVVVETSAERGFVPRIEALEQALGPRTRVLILNSPSNPAGALLSREDLAAIAELVRSRPEVLVLADEIYERFVYGEARYTSFLEVAPDLADRTLVVSGCSKTYAMTGLRLGWALGPKPLIAAMTTLQGQSTSNANTATQWAALAAVTQDQSSVDRMVEAFDQRRRHVVDALRAIPGVTCFDPKGAFYVLPDVSAFFGTRTPAGERIRDADDLTAHLLASKGLVVVPGGPFGAPRHIRLSFATDLGTLDRGLERLRAALAELR